MHVLVVNFNWAGLSHADRISAAEEVAPAFAGIPGMISKLWLSDPQGTRVGGVYTFEDAAACAAYCESELFASVRTNPDFSDFYVADFEVMEIPSRTTGRERLVAH